MTKKLHKSVASAVVDQAEARRKIQTIPSMHGGSAYLVESNKKGRPHLAIAVSKPHEARQVLNISDLARYPNLVTPLGVGLCRLIGSSSSPATREERVAQFRRGILTFLQETDSTECRLVDMNEAFFASFIRWLNCRRVSSGAPWAENTRAKHFSVIKLILDQLRANREYATEAAKARAAIPENIWPGRQTRNNPTARLSLEHLRSISAAAEKEAAQHINEWFEGKRLLDDGNRKLREGSKDYRDFNVCLAELSRRYKGIFPDASKLIEEDYPLGYAVLNIHRSLKLRRYLYPQSRHLVPFILLFSVITAGNADSVLGFKRDQLAPADRLGDPALRVRLLKGRAKSDFARTIPAGPTLEEWRCSPTSRLGMQAIVDFVLEWTERTRTSASASYKDNLFIYCQVNGEKKPKPFRDSGRKSGTGIWDRALTNFCKDHGITRFALNQLRTTVLDEAHQATGDITVAKELGQHVDPNTTWKHYTSAGTRARYLERLGEVFLLRDRWRISQGAIDPRAEPFSHDKSAATPGFYCLDPFDSPRPGQKQGVLCSAYGECPGCPLAAANISSHSAVAHYLALRDSIYQSAHLMSSRTWVDQWSGVLKSLGLLLEQVPLSVLEQASRYEIQLPNVV